ncbi:MAG: tRNA-binding protein [Candidatus Parcubacteria bacterium]|jgi:tRNA-binding protein|nr:tRNA-binding protein [Candidatus Parcubacteria bacterium]
MENVSYQDFLNVELRAGTILEVQDFPEARHPALKLQVDFGEFGIKWSSSQITTLYAKEDLVGRQIIGAVNLGDKKVGAFTSEFLTTGFKDADGNIVLAQPDRPVPNGEKLL